MHRVTKAGLFILFLIFVTACGSVQQDTTPPPPPPPPEDTTPPSVNNILPRSGATGVETDALLIITFTEAMNKASTESAFTITPPIGCSYLWNNDSTRLTCDPNSDLQFGTTYSVSIGASAADEAGNTLTNAFTFSFSTEEEPVTVTASSFSIPRYTDYPTLRLYGVTVYGDEPLQNVYIELECIEDTFENLPMTFNTTVDLQSGSQTVRVPYADGFPYMTDMAVTCYLYMSTLSGPPIEYAWD